MLETFIIITSQLIWSGFCVWVGTVLERRAVERRKRTAQGQLDATQSMFERKRAGA